MFVATYPLHADHKCPCACYCICCAFSHWSDTPTHLLLQLTFPKPYGWDNPDRNQYGTKSLNGAAGTYNYLTDAILDVAATREMYVRRLRTLADRYLAGGRLQQVHDCNWCDHMFHHRLSPCRDSTSLHVVIFLLVCLLQSCMYCALILILASL